MSLFFNTFILLLLLRSAFNPFTVIATKFNIVPFFCHQLTIVLLGNHNNNYFNIINTRKYSSFVVNVKNYFHPWNIAALFVHPPTIPLVHHPPPPLICSCRIIFLLLVLVWLGVSWILSVFGIRFVLLCGRHQLLLVRLVLCHTLLQVLLIDQVLNGQCH